jgi:hypothetical protein
MKVTASVCLTDDIADAPREHRVAIMAELSRTHRRIKFNDGPTSTKSNR